MPYVLAPDAVMIPSIVQLHNIGILATLPDLTAAEWLPHWAARDTHRFIGTAAGLRACCNRTMSDMHGMPNAHKWLPLIRQLPVYIVH